MLCPYCGHNNSRVVDSREATDDIRRRRECAHCALRFTTYERVQTAVALLVTKRDGRREEFSTNKLLHSIRLACAKRPLATGTLDKIVTEIETTLYGLGKAEVLSATIGEMVIKHLESLDRVAYIRFASVYRDFADIETFRQEVDSLLATREAAAGEPLESQPTLFPFDIGVSKPQPRRGRGRPRKRQPER